MNSDSHHPAQDETIHSSGLSDDSVSMMTQGLDVEAGLDEVRSRILHQRVTEVLAHGLDLDAGLAEVRAHLASGGAKTGDAVGNPELTTRRSLRQVFSRLFYPEPIIYRKDQRPDSQNVYVRTVDSQSDELDEMLQLRAEIMPGGGLDREVIARRIRRDPSICRVIYTRSGLGDIFRLDGFVIFYRLGEPVVERILSGEVIGGLGIEDEQILLPDQTDISGVYVASAGGQTRIGKLAAVGLIQLVVDEFRPQWVFGRPATDSSVKVLTNAGFQPLYDPKDIWGREVSSCESRVADRYRELVFAGPR